MAVSTALVNTPTPASNNYSVSKGNAIAVMDCMPNCKSHWKSSWWPTISNPSNAFKNLLMESCEPRCYQIEAKLIQQRRQQILLEKNMVNGSCWNSDELHWNVLRYSSTKCLNHLNWTGQLDFVHQQHHGVYILSSHNQRGLGPGFAKHCCWRMGVALRKTKSDPLLWHHILLTIDTFALSFHTLSTCMSAAKTSNYVKFVGLGTSMMGVE